MLEAEIIKTPPVLEITCAKAPLEGYIGTPAAKNALLPIIVAAATVGAPVRLIDVPDLTDVRALCDILRLLGAKAERDGKDLIIEAGQPSAEIIPRFLSKSLRGSVYALAIPILHYGRAHIGPIGGDQLAGRDLGPHSRALAGFGLTLSRDGEGWSVSGGPPRSGSFLLSDQGVSATALSLIIAANLNGRTTIHEASLQLETFDVARFLMESGAILRRSGRTIVVEGRLNSKPRNAIIGADFSYCATLLFAVAVSGGRSYLPRHVGDRMPAVLRMLSSSGVSVHTQNDLYVFDGKPIYPLSAVTGMHPAFPSDAMPQAMALATQANGSSVFEETLYRHRFDHVKVLRQMRASVEVEGNRAYVHGPRSLHSIETNAKDMGIRETAAIVIAALAADGQTRISSPEVLERGYADLPGDLRRLGAEVRITTARRGNDAKPASDV